MTTYAMIDIETTDTSARTCILSVGIVFFDENEVTRLLYILPELQPQFDAGRRFSASTLDFWMKQSSEAKQDVFSPDARVSIPYAIGQLRELDRADIILSHDMDLDLAAIVDFYNQFAEDNTVPLFHYKKKRCFRTIGRIYDPRCKYQPERTVYHNALDDALVQAKHFMALREEFDIDLLDHNREEK